MADSLNHPLPCHAIHQYFMILGDVSQMFETRFSISSSKNGSHSFLSWQPCKQEWKAKPVPRSGEWTIPQKTDIEKSTS